MSTATRFLITGDWHFKGVNPRARLDNYMEAMIAKIFELYELASAHQVAAIIVPGDLFDSPGATWGVVAELATILQQAPCPVLVVHGNHDIYGGNGESKYRTPFGFLAKLGIVWDIGEQAYVCDNAMTRHSPVVVSGHGFTSETDTEAGKGQFQVPVDEIEDSRRFNVHVIHSMMLDYSPGFEGMRHTLISEVETSADVVICGHVHTGFGGNVGSQSNYVVRRDDGVLFINPGALCRLSASEKEVDRTVQVALLTIDAEGGSPEARADVKLIPLRSAQPGHVVLSREHLEMEQERSGRLEHFLSLLASEGESRYMEIRDIVEDISERDNIPDGVKSEALKRIGNARERLGI